MDAQAPDRKRLIKKKRGIISALANKWKVSKGHVSRVAAGRRRSPTIEKAIAKALGRPVQEIFPEWYADVGSGAA